ncbi:hypothetical protein [Exercitatus varius]|uniref:hypothetical protein n=1 Tax=Exercitatus varius TaxID=67857 RepID=UPI00294B0868|nr:hypothetical protein [Exercitatus varius]MDG2961688.1 hypothetical protein [Exercitatus varius]
MPNKTILLLILISFSTQAAKVGEICHVEADFYWGGIWQPYENNQLICDYWTINGIVFDDDEEVSEEEFELWEEFVETPEYETNEYGDDTETVPASDDTESEADNTD